MRPSSNGTDDEGYRRSLVTTDGTRLVVELDGTAVVVTVGVVPIRLTWAEARRWAVSVLLCAVLAREVEES